MSVAGLHPLESILRLCAAAAPAPWFPRLHAKSNGTAPERLEPHLEQLWVDGLIRRVAGTQETGPGILLTPAGERVLQDAEALQRLRDGRPPLAEDRGALVRRSLFRPARPLVNRLLLAANFLVFGYSAYLAYKQHVLRTFLLFVPGTPQKAGLVGRLLRIAHDGGGISAADVLDGQWWRLLSAGFVNFGLLHLGLNMYGLHVAGRQAEQNWGRGRYLLLYLTSVVVASCLGVAYSPGGCVGASGALCGIIGAEAVWLLFNGRYLPRDLRRRAWFGMVLTFGLLVLISMVPGVSGGAHFGGAVAGAVAAVLLHVQRFGPARWRWLALLGFVPVVWFGFVMLDRARATDPHWQAAEAEYLRDRYLKPAQDALRESKRVYHKRALYLLRQHPSRRDAAAVEETVAALNEQRRELSEVLEALGRAGRFRTEPVESGRQKVREELQVEAELLEQAAQCLREGTSWTDPDEREQRDFEKRFLRRIDTAVKRAARFYHDQVQPLLHAEPQRRDAAAVEKVLADLDAQGRELAALDEELSQAGPYRYAVVLQARKTAREFLAACQQLFTMTAEYLRQGERATDGGREAVGRQANLVERFRQAWRNLVE